MLFPLIASAYNPLELKGLAEREGFGPGRFSNCLVAKGMAKNPCEHGHTSTFSSSSYLSNVAPFDPISEFLELMELMHPSLLQ